MAHLPKGQGIFLPPFKAWLASNIPAVYDNTMSYYEELVALIKYLQDIVVPAVNDNAAAVTAISEAQETLQAYVDNYFDNLDVQEEINNKLDQMAEDGTLQEIITAYIQANVEWTFDTVADMKNATNLVNGSYAQTLGFHTIGDGGSAIYNITDSGTANEMDIIAVGNNLKAHLVDNSSEIEPKIYGAVGDGETDDTNIIRYCLKKSIDEEKVLKVTSKYYISSALLTATDYNDTIKLYIKGNCIPSENYKASNFGGFIFINGLDVFENVTVSGVIEGVAFTPVSRTQTGSIFKNSQLHDFIFNRNYVANVLAFLYDTGVNRTSRISNSKFLTVYYFEKSDTKDRVEFTDSVIENNYINGGAELNDNNCFEFTNWNGSTVINNFIDYYRTIYEPKANVASASGLPMSIGNQYQVFRYLYYKGSNISSISFVSNGDVFNWNDPTKLAKINSFVPHTYTGHDTNTYNVPPYITIADAGYITKINDAYLQDNLANIVFVGGSLTNYNYLTCKLTCNGRVPYNKYNYPVTHADSIYNNGTYKGNLVDIPFSKSEDSMPSVPSLGWSNYYLGQRIKVNNGIYRLIYNFTSSQAEWIEDHTI